MTMLLSGCKSRRFYFRFSAYFLIDLLISSVIFALLVTAKKPQQQKNPLLNDYGGKVQNVPMQTEHGLMMVQHWLDQAMGSFMSAMANNRLKSKSKQVTLEFGACSHNAKSVPEQAKCLSKLLKNKISGKKYLKNTMISNYRSSRRLKLYAPKNMSLSRKNTEVKRSWVGGFRLDKFKKVNKKSKRHIVSSSKGYALKSPNDSRMTPLGSVAHMLMKAVLAAKNKTNTKPWQETVMKIRDSSLKRKQIRKKLEEKSIENMEQFAFRGMKSTGMLDEDLHSIFEDPKKLRNFLTKKRTEKTKNPVQKLIGLMKDGLKIGYGLTGKNITNFEDKNMKIASPRFLSIVPDEDDSENTIDILSPSLFSLHNEGKGLENLTSLPNLVKSFGKKDQQAWLNLIMEAAGVVEEADIIEKEMQEMTYDKKDRFEKKYEMETRAKDGTPMYFTKKNVTEMFGEFEVRQINTYQALVDSFSKEQVKEMNKTGYAMLNATQLHMLYGPQSPYNNSEALNRLTSMNSSYIHEQIDRDIHQTAELSSFKVRMKDVVLSSVTLTSTVLNPAATSQAFVLTPFLLSPIILSPSVLGPAILSPLLFVPIVLSPRVLGPLILTPLAFVPFILSPVVLHPVILSPGIFVPIILSPAVLTPFILSPQVFTPFVLSPLVLSPFILTPAAGSPLVLSPFVLSPIIYSPQFLSALVLSPYFLSPIIMSPLIAFTVVLSPSYLS